MTVTSYSNIREDFGVNSFDGRVARTHNMKLSKILKKGGLVVNQTVVLLIKCVQVQFFATQELRSTHEYH